MCIGLGEPLFLELAGHRDGLVPILNSSCGQEQKTKVLTFEEHQGREGG